MADNFYNFNSANTHEILGKYQKFKQPRSYKFDNDKLNFCRISIFRIEHYDKYYQHSKN